MVNEELKKGEYEHNAGADDELTEQIVEEQIKSLTAELEMFVKNKAKIIEGAERFAKQWARDEKMYLIMLDGDNHKKLDTEIQYKYELVEEYWTIRKDQLNDRYFMDKHMSEAKIEQYKHQVEEIDKQIESDKNKLSELQGE